MQTFQEPKPYLTGSSFQWKENPPVNAGERALRPSSTPLRHLRNHTGDSASVGTGGQISLSPGDSHQREALLEQSPWGHFLPCIRALTPQRTLWWWWTQGTSPGDDHLTRLWGICAGEKLHKAWSVGEPSLRSQLSQHHRTPRKTGQCKKLKFIWKC